jgi:serine/threonine-protein kinase HipA
LRPGADRLAAAQAALFSFLVANADAHAKNISLLHQADGVRLSPMYDVVSAAVYPDLTTELALGVGDEFDPEAIGAAQWSGLAYDFRLNPGQFEQLRRSMADTVVTAAAALLAEAREQAWHVPVLDSIMGVIERRITQL